MDLPAEDPGRYSLEIALMRDMGWTWHDLRGAPADLVEEINFKRLTRLKWEGERKKMDESKAKNNGR